ncbi:hypothetical protein PG996_015367 [Apiospora saccharicola]|uniref:Uncharacterized protein n=1 Tax=Apiospora saccharicola TaxID=335842 RepID=A0ABR1TL11_9PEZI
MPSASNVHPANRGGGLARTRSKAAAPSMRHGNVPSMPPVQGMPGAVAPLRVQRPSAGPRQTSGDGPRSSPPRSRPPPGQMRRRDQEGPDYNSGSGRTGTLRAV